MFSSVAPANHFHLLRYLIKSDRTDRSTSLIVWTHTRVRLLYLADMNRVSVYIAISDSTSVFDMLTMISSIKALNEYCLNIPAIH